MIFQSKAIACRQISTVSRTALLFRAVFNTKLTPYAESITATMYWSIVEDGIVVIAASLPTLHNLVARQSTRSVVRGLRSMMSFRSLRSSASTTVQGPTTASHHSLPSFEEGSIEYGTRPRLLGTEQSSRSSCHVSAYQCAGIGHLVRSGLCQERLALV